MLLRRPQGLTLSLLAHAVLLLAIGLLLVKRATPPVPIEPTVTLVFASRSAPPQPEPATDQAESVLHAMPPPIIASPAAAAAQMHVAKPQPAREARMPQATATAPVAATDAHPVAGMASDLPPTYPEIARRRGQQGRVVVRVEVSADGRPVSVSVGQGSGYTSLDEAAENAVEKWRFIPATRDGQPVPALADVPIRFKLLD